MLYGFKPPSERSGGKGWKPVSGRTTMKKLTLDVDALEVVSFHLGDPQAPRGTVVGADSTIPPYCISFTCGDSQIRPCLAD
jgi:hypothetical protein